MPGIEHRRHDFCEDCPHEKRVSKLERDAPGGNITLVHSCEHYNLCSALWDRLNQKKGG